MAKDWIKTLVDTPLIKHLERSVPKHSRIGDSRFFGTDQFPWAKRLEANWQLIRQELDGVLERVGELPNFQQIMPRQGRISQDDGWKTYYFYAFGFVARKNCERCPQTWQLIKDIPGLKVAFFSILSPGKQIPEHCGKHKGIIRYHLGLRVPHPQTACGIRVGDETVHWIEGKSLIFDDTFPHAAWNNTSGYRAVLFLDVARPLRFPLSLTNWASFQILAFSPLAREAKANHRQWEKRFESTDKE
ncbi:MAG: aspartyl beta-hydroxylase [Cyanobacteria bacterium QS_8_64_29]|nr:MAG: aspartyl beta-hydroxylase [Cyanobacteria bacterium QS_8_64_29]